MEANTEWAIASAIFAMEANTEWAIASAIFAVEANTEWAIAGSVPAVEAYGSLLKGSTLRVRLRPRRA
jgi:hypothetical protein